MSEQLLERGGRRRSPATMPGLHAGRAPRNKGLRYPASAGRDLTVGGPHLAAQAFKAGLVDECHLFITPIVVGGKQALADDVRLELELLDERRFGSGMVYLRYRVRT
jgi:riboflavin biosynthesis pyrimidine reductase